MFANLLMQEMSISVHARFVPRHIHVPKCLLVAVTVCLAWRAYICIIPTASIVNTRWPLFSEILKLKFVAKKEQNKVDTLNVTLLFKEQ
jgi:hypothetical protein